MDISGLRDILTRARILPHLTGLLPPDGELYLVGGAVRDFFLGRPVADFDFTGPFDPTDLARNFAGRIGGTWFFLDSARRQSRVVARREGEEATYDFAPFRGPGLPGDLRLRDFTVNALAVPLLPGGRIGPLLDPLGGRTDLQARCLRACSGGVLQDDPLRVLKGVRHAATLHFTLETETEDRMRAAAGLLCRVAPERVRFEVGQIFATKPISSTISLMEFIGLGSAIFGPPRLAGSADSASTLAGRMEELLALLAEDPELAPLSTAEFEAGLSRAALLKLAAFLRGWQPADSAGSLAGLRFGRRSAAVIRHLLDMPAARGGEVDTLPDRERSRALWAAETGGSVPDSLLFLALLRTEPPAAALARLRPVLRDWLRLAPDGRVPDLVDGRWVREHLNLPEGPALGAALAAVRKEEIAGRVNSPEAARDFLLRRQEKD